MTCIESPALPGTLLLERLPRVKHRTGMSRSEIYRRIREGSFPAPIKIGLRATAWDSRKVDAHIQAQLDAAKLESK